MQPYVHILGRSEIDPTIARVILSFEHFGYLTRVWVENDEHEPYGYRLNDSGKPDWKVIICGNEACVADGCIRKAYFEQLRQPTVEEVIERDAQADHAEALAENLALAQESEGRRQEIARLTEKVNRYRRLIQDTIAVLEASQEDDDIALAAGLKGMIGDDR